AVEARLPRVGFVDDLPRGDAERTRPRSPRDRRQVGGGELRFPLLHPGAAVVDLPDHRLAPDPTLALADDRLAAQDEGAADVVELPAAGLHGARSLLGAHALG